MDLGVPPLNVRLCSRQTLRKSRILVRRLAVPHSPQACQRRKDKLRLCLGACSLAPPGRQKRWHAVSSVARIAGLFVACWAICGRHKQRVGLQSAWDIFVFVQRVAVANPRYGQSTN